MSTFTNDIQGLFTNVRGRMEVFYNNALYLTNEPGFIANRTLIDQEPGRIVQVPVHQSYNDGVIVAEGDSILTASNAQVAITSVNVGVTKKAYGSLFTEESLENGGRGTMAQAIAVQFGDAVAQKVEKSAFNVFVSDSETPLDAIGNITVASVGAELGDVANVEVGVIYSPYAMAYAGKRLPTLKFEEDVDVDGVKVTNTVRNGFKLIRPEFVTALVTNADRTSSNVVMTLNLVADAVENLHEANAPEIEDGLYLSFLTPIQATQLKKDIATINGSASSLQDISMVGENIIRTGLIDQCYGVRFYRSRNLPRSLAG